MFKGKNRGGFFMEKYKFKISVIIPVYNVYDYLEETIKSVINQSIGFKKNIQMILVNDGSVDNSEEICLKYRDMYPDNVIYVKQENQGVSAARNNGLKYAEGEYINFLDSDDKWDRNAFKNVYDFFSVHGDDIDVVSCKINFFGCRKGEHPLNYKFDSDRVINIEKESSLVQLSSCTCFIRKVAIDLISNKFDCNLKYGEDALFINKIILEKGKYGILNYNQTYY